MPTRLRNAAALFLENRWLYLMLAPTVLWFLIFSYGPMFGLVIAFEHYQPGLPFISPKHFVGFDNFLALFDDRMFWRAFGNTCIISVYRIVVCLPAAVALAVLLSEIPGRIFKSAVQTATYIPHFLSWVVVSVFAITLLSPQGGLNTLFASANLPALRMDNRTVFRAILIGADVWKDMGFNSVLFIAAILGINPALFESAEIDGASRIQRIFYITIPCIRGTIMAVLVLWIGTIITSGFDQVFNMYNPAVYATGDIINTYIYRIAFKGSDNYGLATAAGLFQGVLSLGLILLANLFSRRIGENIL